MFTGVMVDLKAAVAAPTAELAERCRPIPSLEALAERLDLTGALQAKFARIMADIRAGATLEGVRHGPA